ncbi:translation initiation factor eIF2B subunit delta-like isoform X1 [Haliotis cracherodii]|uniref:translation initiation factor eIF2B subunit delta-like isoform X1 n=1 Tax=Haliotis cracherodii TaxID=6455 RepID=UPI0039E74203
MADAVDGAPESRAEAKGQAHEGSKKKNKSKNKKSGGDGGSKKPPKEEVVKKQDGQSQGPSKDDTTKDEGQDVPQKSKAELKAERRAKQEAQRALKATKKAEGPAGQQKKETVRVPDHVKADVPETQKKLAKKLERQQIAQRANVQRKVRLFNHLYQYEREVPPTHSLQFSNGGIHPAVVKLGVQYAEGLVSGSNARCVALLAAFKKVITDYNTPPQKELSRDLENKIKPYISFLVQCRPLSVSMGNAIKYLKWNISHMPRELSDAEAKQRLNDSIDSFIHEKVLMAGKAISIYAGPKITDGDVIVVYACSSLIKRVLCDAHQQGRKFRVIVIDGRPKMEGKEMLRRLVKAGIQCTYVLINSASYVMQEATKVFLGSHALLANGFVMSRVGSSLVALMARSCNVPVLVCCETYKFCERVQTDSFVFNELGDPSDLVQVGSKEPYLSDWKDHSHLTLLNLVYDVTPPELISAVITELGMIPCTSVPVVLRVTQAQTNET